MAQKLSLVNKKFEPYRNKYAGESCIFLASGPSLNNFDVDRFKRENNIKYVCGVNSVILYTQELDFYFFGDRTIPTRQRNNLYLDKIHLLSKDTLKFACVYRDGIPSDLQVSPEFAKEVNAITYDITRVKEKYPYSSDISKYCMTMGSIAFQSLQFLLFCGFNTIYLVGCDCGTSGSHSYFDPGQKNKELLPHNYRYTLKRRMNDLIGMWKKFKKFSDKSYPNTNIVSVNPLGLKGLFPNDIFL